MQWCRAYHHVVTVSRYSFKSIPCPKFTRLEQGSRIRISNFTTQIYQRRSIQLHPVQWRIWVKFWAKYLPLSSKGEKIPRMLNRLGHPPSTQGSPSPHHGSPLSHSTQGSPPPPPPPPPPNSWVTSLAHPPCRADCRYFAPGGKLAEQAVQNIFQTGNFAHDHSIGA